MKKKQDRKTYASRNALYNLDPAQVFSVVEGLETYLSSAKNQAMKDNPDELRPAAVLIGDGRRLVICTEVVNNPGFLETFNLAELVLSDDNSRLTLTTHKHPRVAIPPRNLQDIAKKYQVK